MDRPLCPCHGEPMTRNGRNRPEGPQKWTCSVTRRERSRDDYWKRGGRGQKAAMYQDRLRREVCGRCGRPRLTESVCWDCLNVMEERHAVRQ